VPVHFRTSESIHQWQPQLNRIFSFEPPPVPAITNWPALEEAWRLRRSFVRTARLLQGASEFHLNWSQLRGAMTGGYRETGESAPVMYGHRISLHG